MKLGFNVGLADNYKSQSQKIRVLTENWVSNSIFCPNCGESYIEKYENNRPVADFYCHKCTEEYELKSKNNFIGRRIVDGAYKSMIERLSGDANPNFFIMTYNLCNFSVSNFLVIPKHFFIPDIIEKRAPLSENARRAGWMGCNIVISKIPESGKVFFVKNGAPESKDKILENWQKTIFLRSEKDLQAKSWLLDIMSCIEKIKKSKFYLDEVYAFEKELCKKHPDNSHIKDKIRQQLQILRDRGYLSFIGGGKYRLN